MTKEKIMLVYKYVTCRSNATAPNASEITNVWAGSPFFSVLARDFRTNRKNSNAYSCFARQTCLLSLMLLCRVDRFHVMRQSSCRRDVFILSRDDEHFHCPALPLCEVGMKNNRSTVRRMSIINERRTIFRCCQI